MSEYLILIAAQNDEALSAADEQKCIAEYGVWAQTLAEKHILARRLSLNEGSLIKSKASVKTDGPFIEAKELIAGFVLVQANSLKEAEELASSCPLNEYFDLFVKETK